MFLRRERGATRPGFAGDINTKLVSAYGIIIGLLPELQFKKETLSLSLTAQAFFFYGNWTIPFPTMRIRMVL